MTRVTDVKKFHESTELLLSRIKTMTPEDAKDILFRVGVLDESGKVKEQICTGDGYGGDL